MFSFNGYSQINFENGYFINNSGEKIDCIIKNRDWKDNPSEFEYKLSEKSEIKSTTIQDVKEFGINNVLKYIRGTVNIDRSSDNLTKLSPERNPIFQKEQLFLKVLVEGKAKLFRYYEGSIIRYFYKTNNSNIEQLVYKRYKSDQNKIGVNNLFKQQLLLNVNCHDVSKNKIKYLAYNKNALIKFFMEYNECENSDFINYESKQQKDLFNLGIKLGLNNSSFSMNNGLSDQKLDFDNKFGFRFGIEAEFILPYNKNKWAIFLEPTYQYYKSEKDLVYIQTSTLTKTTNVDIDYSSIELPLGLRYYSFINDNSKLFFDVSYLIDFPLSSSISAEREEILDLEIDSRNNIAFGVGFKYNNRYSMEFRYHTSRNLLGDRAYWNSNYNTLSIIFGYTIF